MAIENIRAIALDALSQFYEIRADLERDGETLNDNWRLMNAELMLQHYLPEIWDGEEGRYASDEFEAIYFQMLRLA